MTYTLTHYRQVWTHKSAQGREYVYECRWSDGATTTEDGLPWGRMAGAVELPNVNHGPAGTWPVEAMDELRELTRATNEGEA